MISALVLRLLFTRATAAMAEIHHWAYFIGKTSVSNAEP
jgi:hypothetical protein